MDGARGGFTMNRKPIRRKTRTPGLDSDGCGDLGWSGGSERSAAASARAGAARFELKWIEPRQASSSSLVSPESIARRTPSLVSTHEKSPPARPSPLTPSAAPNFCPSPPPRPATPSDLLSGRPQSTPVDRTRCPNPTFFPVVDCSSCRFQSPWRRLVVREAKCARNFNGHRIPAVGFSPFFQHDSPEKKPRISTARRLRPDSNLTVEQSSTLSMSSRSNSKRIPSGDNVASDGEHRRREIYLNGPSLERASKRITEGVLSPPSSKNSNKSKGSNQLHSEASASTRKSESSHRIHVSTGNDDLSTTQKPRKVKLKIGGISRTIPTKPNPDIPGSRSSAAKPTQPGDSWHRQKHGNQTESAKDKGRLPSSQDKKTKKLRTIDTLTPEQPARVQSESSSDPVRKSRRIAKKSTFDSEFDEEYDSSTLEASNVIEVRVRDSRNKGGSNSKNNASKKDGSRSTVYKADNDFVTPQSNRDGNKRLRDSTAADVDDTEEEPVSDSELESENKKQKAVTELPSNVKSEPLTTRRRALQSWMDGNSNSTVEFPDGLPAASSRSKKEKLSEAEVLAKKAEAAQRRKLQVEKASKESEAEAIRKILGLDTEKKKEERKQKEREEKEKAARAQELARNSIRWVMGPTGTVVSFPDGVDLPSIFNSKPCSYPPPREQCAGPSCTNVYRYRDSKLKLPLCSLECYKAVRGNA